MADGEIFELFPVRYGQDVSDRACMHVRVASWTRPPGFKECDGIVCITADACEPDELDAHIDELIAELRNLKLVGQRKMGPAGAS